MPRRVLMVLSQLPHDPASGAAISMLAVARLLAEQGFEVASLSSSASEGGKPLELYPFLHRLGVRFEIDRRAAVGRGCPVARFTERGVRYTVMDTGPAPYRDWDFAHGGQFTRLLTQSLESFAPDVVFTYGGTPPEQTRRSLARSAGAALVFAVHNLGYLHPLAFNDVDESFLASDYLRRRYRSGLGLDLPVLYPPLDPAEAVAADPDPRFVTFCNPTPNKGVFVFVRIAAELGRRRPDIPVRVVEGRGTREQLLAAGRSAGIDLASHPNLTIVPTFPRGRDMFRHTRVLLMPSLWDEPFGRLAGEALLNAVPCLVSSRGGLPETVGDRAQIIDVPAHITPERHVVASADEVAPWVDAILRLWDDPEHARRVCERCRGAGVEFTPQALAGAYADVFARARPRREPMIRTVGVPGGVPGPVPGGVTPR